MDSLKPVGRRILRLTSSLLWCGLFAISAVVAALPGLRLLRLQDNVLQGTIPSQFGQLSALL
jgi:hypothetical protein